MGEDLVLWVNYEKGIGCQNGHWEEFEATATTKVSYY